VYSLSSTAHNFTISTKSRYRSLSYPRERLKGIKDGSLNRVLLRNVKPNVNALTTPGLPEKGLLSLNFCFSRKTKQNTTTRHMKSSPGLESTPKLRGWLHERFNACDLLQIAYAICCICDLVSDKNHFLSFFLHQIADAIKCICDLVCDSASVSVFHN
jgi:hypothetical protein